MGQSSIEKRQKIAGILSEVGHDAVVLTAQSQCLVDKYPGWGRSLHALLFEKLPGIFYKDGKLELFTDKRKVPANVANRLPEGVELLDRDSFDHGLDALGKAAATVRLDPTSTAAAISSRLTVLARRSSTGMIRALCQKPANQTVKTKWYQSSPCPGWTCLNSFSSVAEPRGYQWQCF